LHLRKLCGYKYTNFVEPPPEPEAFNDAVTVFRRDAPGPRQYYFPKEYTCFSKKIKQPAHEKGTFPRSRLFNRSGRPGNAHLPEAAAASFPGRIT
jgi:hypothetical protein